MRKATANYNKRCPDLLLDEDQAMVLIDAIFELLGDQDFGLSESGPVKPSQVAKILRNLMHAKCDNSLASINTEIMIYFNIEITNFHIRK